MSKTPSAVQELDRAIKASELCLACGLCCNGLIFGHAVLKPEEVEPITQLGLPVYHEQSTKEDDSYEAFRLPCPCYRDNRCAIYSQRPRACQTYRCLLLRRFLDGKYSFEDSHDLIRIAQTLVRKIKQQIGDNEDSRARLWDRIREFYRQQDRHADLEAFQIDVKTLWNFCYYQFDSEVAGTQYPKWDK